MKKINFSQLLIATDIARKHCENMDCREEFANMIFRNGDGIAAHALALKIYNSSGETEYTDEEVVLMRQYVEGCKPFFIDAFNKAIDNQVTE